MKELLFISLVFYPDGTVATERLRKLIKYKPRDLKCLVLCLPREDLEDLGRQTFDESRYEEIDNKYSEITLETRDHKRSIWRRIVNNLDFLITTKFLFLDKYYIKVLGVNQIVSILSVNCHRLDKIVATGPVFTNHLLAYYLSRKMNVPYTLDFRDPWSINEDYYSKFAPIKRYINRAAERMCLAYCESAIFTTEIMKARYIEIYPSLRDKFHVVTNGYDT
jgi:hypothetical protein